jgi:hypothetical protein
MTFVSKIHVLKIDEIDLFRGFGQAKFADGGLILGLSQFTQLPQLKKMMLDFKKVKIDSNIYNLLH